MESEMGWLVGWVGWGLSRAKWSSGQVVDEAARSHYHHQLDLYIVVVLMIWMVRFQIIRKKQSILRPLSLCCTATSDPSALVYLRIAIVQVSSEQLNAF